MHEQYGYNFHILPGKIFTPRMNYESRVLMGTYSAFKNFFIYYYYKFISCLNVEEREREREREREFSLTPQEEKKVKKN